MTNTTQDYREREDRTHRFCQAFGLDQSEFNWHTFYDQNGRTQ